jgi:hypothetical protein
MEGHVDHIRTTPCPSKYCCTLVFMSSRETAKARQFRFDFGGNEKKLQKNHENVFSLKIHESEIEIGLLSLR